jgi:hypothetical protein
MKKKFAVVLENTLPGRLNVKQEDADNLQMTEYLENMTEKEYSKYNIEEFYCMRLKKGGLNFQDIKMHSKKINVTPTLQQISFSYQQLFVKVVYAPYQVHVTLFCKPHAEPFSSDDKL